MTKKQQIISIAISIVVLAGSIYAVRALGQKNSDTQETKNDSMTTTVSESEMQKTMPNPEATDSVSPIMANETGMPQPTVDTQIVKEIKVTATNFKYDVTEIKVKQGQKIKLVFVNSQGLHDFIIDELNVKTAQLSAGKQETVEFTANKTGTYEFYCSVGQHRQMGMVGKLIVE